MSEILKVKGLKKYFPVMAGIFRHTVSEIKAVDEIDFAIHEGRVLGLVGESGSGKSTAARAAVRLIEPTAGKLTFMGEDLSAYNAEQLKHVRKKIQIVFQDPYSSLNPRKTVATAIGEGLYYHGIVTRDAELEERVVEILEMVGLRPDFKDRYPHELSGGQQQRVCIGRAIALSPKLLICDEAVSALDVSVRAQILNLLMDLKDRLGLSMLFITHDLSVVRHISNTIAVMHRGKIVEYEATQALFESPKHPYTQKLLKAIPKYGQTI